MLPSVPVRVKLILFFLFSANVGKNGNGRVCCLVKCSVVSRKALTPSQAKGASSESLPSSLLPLCDSASTKPFRQKSTNDNLGPMPSCSDQAVDEDKSFVSGMTGSRFLSFLSNAPSSAPASSHSTPRHLTSGSGVGESRLRMTMKRPLRVTSDKESSEANQHPLQLSLDAIVPSEADACLKPGSTNDSDDSSSVFEASEQPWLSPGSSHDMKPDDSGASAGSSRDMDTKNKLDESARPCKEIQSDLGVVKPRHQSAGEGDGRPALRSPKAPSKVSLEQKRSRRHTIANDVSTSSVYPEGGFRYMAGYNSVTTPRRTSHRDRVETRSPSSSLQSSPSTAARRPRTSPKKQRRELDSPTKQRKEGSPSRGSGKQRSPKLQ